MTVESLLDRPLYGMTQTDSLLGLKPGTARRWIDGYKRGRRTYAPVIRRETTGIDTVTWGEFVEARLLANYRNSGAPMLKLRPAVERLRQEFGEYPLAHARPFVGVEGRELVRKVQDEVDLDRALSLVVVRNDQLVLADAAQDFTDRIQFDEDRGFVSSLRPWGREESKVRIDPDFGYGEPVVRGVRTEILGELYRAGDTPEMLSNLYELPISTIHDAIRFEFWRAEQAAA